MKPYVTTVGTVLKEIVSGKSIQTLNRPAQSGEYGILKVSAVTWGEFRPQESKAMPLDYDPGECPRPMDGDILISRANTRELVGAPVMVNGDYPQLLLSDKLLKLVPDESAVDRRYLVRALRSTAASQHFFKCAGGSSGSMTNITQSDIRTAPILLPSLPEQRRIAAILDKADTLRAKRREVLAQLDCLAQSIFVEMFGDLFLNSKGFPVFRLGDVCDVRDGTHDSPAFISEGYPLVTSKNLKNGCIDLCDVGYISKSDYISINKRSKVDKGDLLMPMIGTIGNPVLVREEPNFAIKNMALIKFTEKSPSRLFVHQFLNGDCFDRLVANRNKGGTQKFLSLGEIRGLPLPIPPLSLQREFDRRIERLSDLKECQSVAMTETDVLFNSLQNQAFRGKL